MSAKTEPTDNKEKESTDAASENLADDNKSEKSPKKVLGVGFGNIFKDGGVKLKNTGKPNSDEKVIGAAGIKEKRSSATADSDKDAKKAPESKQEDKLDKKKDKRDDSLTKKEKSKMDEPRDAKKKEDKSPGVVRRRRTETDGPGEADRTPKVADTDKKTGDPLDAVQTGEKLSHITTSRPRGPQRRPPSMIQPNAEESPNGLDVDEKPTMADSKSSESRKSLTETSSDKEDKGSSLAKKNSFLKELDSALGGGPRVPSIRQKPVSPSPSTNLDDEVQQLRDEIKSIKDTFANQMKDLHDLLKTQATKIITLEKDIEKLQKKDGK